MSFIWKHKFLSLLIILLILYWHHNHAHRFGYAREGLVIYNRIPVLFFDIYVTQDQEVVIQENFKKSIVLRKWIERDLVDIRGSGEPVQLFVGTGFDSTSVFSLSPEDVGIIRNKGYSVTLVSSPEAMKLYNAALDKGKKAAIALHLL